MDTLTFISESTKALAWPITVIILVLILRGPLIRLIPTLKKLKYRDLELDFAEEVAALEAGAIVVNAASRDKLHTPTSAPYRSLRLLELSPRAAVLEAWLEVELAATEVASSFWSNSSSSGNIFKLYPKLAEYLLQCGVIDQAQLETFNRLRALRNKAAHAEDLDLSEKDVRSYIEIAAALALQIRAG